MKVLGVIGGLGPEATSYFLQLITNMSDAQKDQDHMEVILYSKPSIPDRTGYILGKSNESPVPAMVSTGRTLKDAGAELLAIPCVTAHYFRCELEEEIGIPILDGVGETARFIKEEKIQKAGILATDGTIQGKVVQNALERYDISWITPGLDNQKKVMELIYHQLKAGKKADMRIINEVSEELFKQGAQVILLACTELSLLKRDYTLPPGYLDMLDILARKAVQSCHYLRKEYENLITV